MLYERISLPSIEMEDFSVWVSKAPFRKRRRRRPLPKIIKIEYDHFVENNNPVLQLIMPGTQEEMKEFEQSTVSNSHIRYMMHHSVTPEHHSCTGEVVMVKNGEIFSTRFTIKIFTIFNHFSPFRK